MYGSPMVAASNSRIRSVGSPASDGFQCSAGKIGSSAQLPGETHGAALQWSPDDAFFTIYDADSGGVVLLPNGAASGNLLMLTDGPASWQRTAP